MKKPISVEFQWMEVRSGAADRKVFHHVPVVLEGKNLFIHHDDYKYRIKIKEVDEVDASESDSLLLKVGTLVFAFGNFRSHGVPSSSVSEFARRLQLAIDRSRSVAVQQFQSFLESSSAPLPHDRANRGLRAQPHRSKQRGTFGKGSFHSPTGFATSVRRVPKPRYHEQFSDDEENDATLTSPSEMDGGAFSESKTKNVDDWNGEKPLKAESLPPVDVDEDELDAVALRRTTESSKKRIKRLLDDSSESSDEESIGKPDLTTPAAQRVVSPSTSKPPETEETQPDPSQRTIGSFFLPKSDAGTSRGKPTQSASTPATASTPTRRTSPVAPGTGSKSLTKSSIQQSSLWLHSSPARSDPVLKRKERLFGVRMSHSPVIKKNPVDLLLGEDETDSTNPQAAIRTLKRMRLTPHRLSHGTGPPWKADAYPETPLQGNTGGSELSSLPPCLFRGIRNLGNTCYCAASLQMLASAFDFIQALQGRGGRLAQSMVKVANELLSDNQGSTLAKWPVDPRDVKEAMDLKTDKFAGYEQRDAHEFLGDLVDYIHEELEEEQKRHHVGSQASSKCLPTDDFRMTIQKVLKCESCGYSRSKDEMYRHLSVDIVSGATAPSVERGLSQFFQSELRELKCEKCADGTHASETLSVSARPRFLLLHLKRFIWVEKRSSTAALAGEENREPNVAPAVEYVFQKNQAAVSIPEFLTLNPFCSDVESEESSSRYRLRSLVHHIGLRPSSGHYTADAVRMCNNRSAPVNQETGDTKSEANEKQTEGEEISGKVENSSDRDPTTQTQDAVDSNLRWVSFDDSTSLFNDLDRLLQSKGRQSSAYILLYALDNDGK